MNYIFYVIAAIAIILILLFIKSFKKVNNLSEDATLLVAYIKYAGKKKSFLEKDKSDEEFYEKKYNDLLTACYLLNKFCLQIKDLPATYRFNIRENGEMYGETFEVQVGPFMSKLANAVSEIVNNFPVKYQCKINSYMQDPFSSTNKKIGEDINNKLFSKSKYLKKYADAARESVKNMDYMYILCK